MYIMFYEDRVNTQNVSIVVSEFEGFCKRREDEKYVENPLETEKVKILYNKLKEIQNN